MLKFCEMIHELFVRLSFKILNYFASFNYFILSLAPSEVYKFRDNYLSHWEYKLFRIFAKELKIKTSGKEFFSSFFATFFSSHFPHFLKKKSDSNGGDTKNNGKFSKYVGGMIRKILYFLLRRINFSPRKKASSSRKMCTQRKRKREREEEIFRWKKYPRNCGKKKTREMYVYTIKQ